MCWIKHKGDEKHPIIWSITGPLNFHKVAPHVSEVRFYCLSQMCLFIYFLLLLLTQNTKYEERIQSFDNERLSNITLIYINFVFVFLLCFTCKKNSQFLTKVSQCHSSCIVSVVVPKVTFGSTGVVDSS